MMTGATPIGFPTVQLLHRLPDGSAHVDWMIAPDIDGRERLVTFRVERRVDELSPASSSGAAGAGSALDAVRIADHRTVYLDYEGPVADAPGAAPATRHLDRGRVERIRGGVVTRWDRTTAAWDLEIAWDGSESTQRVRLEPVGDARWRVIALSSTESDSPPSGNRKEQS